MSVILFAKAAVYQDMTDSYEGLKHLLRPLYAVEDEESKFYTSLRRLYFANVAAFLCQSHDETPLSAEELQAIDPFAHIQGRAKLFATSLVNLQAFLRAWGSLRYNLTTNAGERYEPKEAFSYMEGLGGLPLDWGYRMQGKAFESWENQAMEEKKVVPAGSFCWNEGCADYGQVGKGNIIKNGKTDKGVQRYRCQTCTKTFTETKGTMFYRCRHSQETIVECLAMVGDRKSLAAIHRIKGVKEETVCEWLERAAAHVEQFEEHLVRARKLKRVQLDALWTYVGHKGEKVEEMKKRQEERFGVEQPLT